MSVRHWIPLSLVCVLTLLVSVDAFAGKPPHRLQIAVGTDRVTVSGATPGGSVILVGYELATRDYAPLYRQVRAEGTSTSEGIAEIVLNRELSPNGYWVAFDLATGAHGAIAGSRRQLREAELRDEAVPRGANGKRDVILTRFDFIYTMVIRPGAGVWEGLGGDGAEGDADGALNGNIRVSTGALRKIAKTVAALDGLQRGDIVAVFVPHQMGFLVTEVKQ